MNRKGFTLIELLVTIFVIALVLGLTTFGIISAVNSSKEKAVTLSLKSIKEGARTYSTEKGEDYWNNGDSNTYFCVTIDELINKGILDKNAKNIENGTSKYSYIAVVKDKITRVVKKELLLSESNSEDTDYKEAFELCTGNIKVEEIETGVSLGDTKSYTDTLTINYTDATFKKDEENINIKEKYCNYGEDSTNVNNRNNVNIVGNTCTISNLKQENTYYVNICEESESGSISCSDTQSITTKSIKEPSIEINSNTSVKITFYNDNFYNNEEGNYYFKSSSNGEVNNEVSSCTLENNIYVCDSNSTSIVKDTWYKTNSKDIIVTYQDTGDIKVEAETRDKTGNSKSKEKEFSLYKITFDIGTADSINNQTSSIEKMCLADKNSTCSITSPSIEKEGYDIKGWNTNKNAASSSWNVNTKKDISVVATYYPILKIKTFNLTLNKGTGVNTIYYKVNGAGSYSSSSSNKTIKDIKYGTTYEYYGTAETGYAIPSCTETAPCFITIKENRSILLSANLNSYTITFDANGGNGYMTNINATYGNTYTLTNSFTRNGYTFNGWNTEDNGSGTNYSNNAQVKNLTATNGATITLYAQWKINTYTITYNANGGSGAPSTQTKVNGVNLTLSSTKPTRAGYTFLGWSTSSTASSIMYSAGGVFTTDANTTLYAVWQINKVIIHLNTNGGSVTGTNTNYSNGNNGAVLYKGSDVIHTINYGTSLGGNGLLNYNNSSYLKIIRGNDADYEKYAAVEKNEWKCLSGNCSRSTYDQDTSTYTSSSFCDASNSDCEVTLGVNWAEKINGWRCSEGINYYITNCNIDTKDCDYTKIIGKNKTGTISRNKLTQACTKTMYVNTRCVGLRCRETDEESDETEIVHYNCKEEVIVYSSTTPNGWYQPVDKNCYLKPGDGIIDYLVDSSDKVVRCNDCSGGDSDPGGGSDSPGSGTVPECGDCTQTSDCMKASADCKVVCEAETAGGKKKCRHSGYQPTLNGSLKCATHYNTCL